MLRWDDLADVPRAVGPTVVTIGVFDGVHRGHQRVIGRVVELARQRNATSVVVTFDPHPAAVVRPDAAPLLLASLDHRLERFESLSVDAVLVLRFDKERSLQPAEAFARELAGALRPVAVVVGDDFRFGHKAAGDVDLLRRLGAELGFEVEGLARRDAEIGPDSEAGGAAGSARSDADVDTATVSSTAVRRALERGDVAGARRLLGYPFRVEGVVVEGAHRGRELGFPTANVPAPAGMALPADGVYAGWLTIRDTGAPETAGATGGSAVTSGERARPAGPLPAAISVGTNPQFGKEPRRVESYVLDRDDLELYDLTVRVEFVDRVRGQQRFPTVDALIAQMTDDVERVRQILTAE
ncbi:MAG TPA: bifunctional riboflavin kinase/FAD synthetase [Actinopolymorphaceae bacterium]